MKQMIFAILCAIIIATAVHGRGLEITEIEVNVDYDEAYTYRIEHKTRSSSDTVSNNSKINADVLPGSNVTFTIRLENTLQGDDEIRDVFARVRIEEIDDGSDLEDTSIDVDLEAGNDDRLDVKFKIPLDVEAGTYNVIIEGEGQGENQTNFRTEAFLKMEVKKESHDIRITSFYLNPGIVECNRKTKITAKIMNLGRNFENPIAIEFQSSTLGINSIDSDISLESSDDASIDEKEYTKNLNIEIPISLKSGVYPVYANLYWKNTILFDQKISYLTVRDCKPSGQKTDQPAENQQNKNLLPSQENDMGSGEEGFSGLPAKFKPSLAFLFMVATGALVFVILILFIFSYSRKNFK